KPLADDRRIRLSRKTPETTSVVGDERWIRQMLFNLLDNAIKYTEPSGLVSVSLARSEDHALISVRDTGKGIPAEELPRLFERFYRVDKSRNNESGGSGLGLAIAMWVARSHGGDISVESKVGSGSTFQVVLPLDKDPRPALQPGGKPADRQGTGIRAGRARGIL